MAAKCTEDAKLLQALSARFWGFEDLGPGFCKNLICKPSQDQVRSRFPSQNSKAPTFSDPASKVPNGG